MKLKFILPALMVIMSHAAYSQQTQSGRSFTNQPVASEKGLFKVVVMYPFAEGKTFNMDYYETKHMPMVAGYLGSNLVKYTIDKGVLNGALNAPVAPMAVGTFYVKDVEAYRKAIEPHREALRADFENYTNATPVIFVSQVVK